jgi:hypothetical protein
VSFGECLEISSIHHSNKPYNKFNSSLTVIVIDIDIHNRT